MAYVEYWSIIDGATDSELFVHDGNANDERELNVWLDGLRDWADEKQGNRAEVYYIHHPHGDSEECECSQFEQDHNPVFVYEYTMTWEEAYERYDDSLDSDGPVTVAGMEFEPSRILREVDPIAYRTGFNDWLGGQCGY